MSFLQIRATREYTACEGQKQTKKTKKKKEKGERLKRGKENSVCFRAGNKPPKIILLTGSCHLSAQKG